MYSDSQDLTDSLNNTKKGIAVASWGTILQCQKDDLIRRLQLAASTDEVYLAKSTDGGANFTILGSLALKGDLSDLVIEKGFQKSIDIPAGNAYSTTECDIEYTVPSGYKALAVYKGLVTNGTCCVYNSYFKDGKARLVISNLNGSQKTVTAYAFILFIKS